jgi:hypothetical protein
MKKSRRKRNIKIIPVFAVFLLLGACDFWTLGTESDLDINADDLEGVIVNTSSKVTLRTPIRTEGISLQAVLLYISYRYGGETGGGDKNSSVRIRLFDDRERTIGKELFSFAGNSPPDDLAYSGIHETVFLMTSAKLSSLAMMEITLTAGGGKAGIKNIVYRFDAEDPGTGGAGTNDPGADLDGNGGETDPGSGSGMGDSVLNALRVKGNKIEYGGGGSYTQVVLRGVNVGDLYHFKKYNLPGPDFSYIRNSMNANAVRMAVHPSLWISDKAANLALLKENVQKALTAGLFVIVDYHTIGFPDAYEQPLPGDDIAYSKDFSVAQDFWNTVSGEIIDGRVLFEIWNEPVSAGSAPKDARSWAALKPYWEQLTEIIRGNGSGSIIIAGGDYWTHNLKGIKDDLLEDGNTAYAWHIYGNHGGNDPGAWERALDGLNALKPVLVTEWGYSSDSREPEYAPPDQFADKFVSGFLTGKDLSSFAWGYDPWYTPSMLVNGSYTKFSDYGKYVVNYLQSQTQAGPESRK